MANDLTFGGVSSSSFGIHISGEAQFNAPARDTEIITIPGKNGSLIIDHGRFENITVTYPAYCYKSIYSEFIDTIDAFRNILAFNHEYQKLEDTFHPNEYRIGAFISGLEVDPIMYNSGATFDITFECKPQRYLASGEIPVTFTENGSIVNPTTFESSPIIQVTGDGTVAIGPYRFTVSGNPGTITIDTELMEVYIPAGEPYELTDENGDPIVDELNTILEAYNGPDQNTAMTSYVSFQDSLMPKIPAGEVNIGMQSTITELVIIPRWWRI